MKTIAYFLFFFGVLIGNLNALESPKSSKFDKRIGFVVFNANDVFKINAKNGYVSVIEFGKDERIINTATGFSEGWEIVDKENLLFIKPKPLITKYIQSEDPENQSAANEIVIQPNALEWKTNLIVTTNYSMYVFELNLGQQNIFKLSFTYPDKENAELAKLNAKLDDMIEKNTVATSLERTPIPRNWEFYMRVAKGSRGIAPNFAYDDGVFTYLGFDNTKTFPSVFGLENGKEQILNTHIRKDGNYDVLVIQNTMEKIVLRSGDKVVGILNKGYGKNPPNKTQETSNDKEVERVLSNEAQQQEVFRPVK